jgi:hypothetical protein
MKQSTKVFRKKSMTAGITALGLQCLSYLKIKRIGNEERIALCAVLKQIGCVLDVIITFAWQQKSTAIQSVSLRGMHSLERKTKMEKSLTSTRIYFAGTKLTNTR